MFNITYVVNINLFLIIYQTNQISFVHVIDLTINIIQIHFI